MGNYTIFSFFYLNFRFLSVYLFISIYSCFNFWLMPIFLNNSPYWFFCFLTIITPFSIPCSSQTFFTTYRTNKFFWLFVLLSLNHLSFGFVRYGNIFVPRNLSFSKFICHRHKVFDVFGHLS